VLDDGLHGLVEDVVVSAVLPEDFIWISADVLKE